MSNQAVQTTIAPSDDPQNRMHCVVLGTAPRGRLEISEALQHVGCATFRRISSPTCDALDSAHAILIDGESFGMALPWIVEQALATTQTPILIFGSVGDLAQTGSPRIFVAHRENGPRELHNVLDGIVKHLLTTSAYSGGSNL